MTHRGLPPDTEPRIAVAIQHVASRDHLLPRLLDELACPLTVINGDFDARNPWETYRRCLAVQEDWPPGEPTHLVVIQDDALLASRFMARLSEYVVEKPGDLLCLYVPELPVYMGRAMHIAHAAGERFAIIPGGMFTPLVAACWPVWMAQECLAWAETTPTSVSRRCDDAQVARFMRTRRYRPLGVVPSLVDHDEQTPSTLGLGRYKRSAAVLG